MVNAIDLLGDDDSDDELSKLEAVRKELDRQIAERKRIKMEPYIEKIRAFLQSNGLGPDDVFPKPPPKFKDPKGPGTWTGKGKNPQWYLDRLAEGYTQEQLLTARSSDEQQ